mgnify:CR=1 FL=1
MRSWRSLDGAVAGRGAMPSVVTLGINWKTGRPDRALVAALLQCIDPFIDPNALFDANDDTCATERVGRLCGMICYYGRHYVACFWSEAQAQWLTFDDSYVRPVGATWAEAVAHCSQAKYQPLLLFYEILAEGAAMPPVRAVVFFLFLLFLSSRELGRWGGGGR